MEIENKYLVRALPKNLKVVKISKIAQYYFMLEGKSEARVRRKETGGATKYYLTIKVGEGLVRTEVEIEITKAQFDELARTTNRVVAKTRIVTEEGFEIDIYEGSLTGLIIVEKEFSSEEEANNFVPPSWFGENVTQDKRYKNKNLATKGL